jgi:hypothetical protein
MSYEAKGIRWKKQGETGIRTMASYHCDFEGRSVRYNHPDGYFTVVETLEHPFFVEEPGMNVLQCPWHGTWLYRSRDKNNGEDLA